MMLRRTVHINVKSSAYDFYWSGVSRNIGTCYPFPTRPYLAQPRTSTQRASLEHPANDGIDPFHFLKPLLA